MIYKDARIYLWAIYFGDSRRLELESDCRE